MSSDTELDAMQKALSDPHREISLDELTEILETTIKYDRENKVITFLVCLGTYTDEEQSNILYIAETTTGKSYIPLEILQYFPQEDIEKLSYASPMSFFHLYGKKQTEEKGVKEDGTPETHTYYLIDMSKKVYIFKDMPSMQLLERLRSLLSHDEREMQLQITNKSEKAGYRTQHYRIRGYPTFIFCTATTKIFDPQESTRFFVLSPEIDTAKIEEAIKLLALRKGNKQFYKDAISGMSARHFLSHRIELIKAERILDVVIPNVNDIADDFIKNHPFLNPRAMRDFGRLISLIKYWAMLNCFSRKMEEKPEGKIVYADKIDVEVGFILYEAICTSNEMGLSPENYGIYKRIFEAYDRGIGLTKEEISAAYLKVFHRPLGNNRLNRDIIPNLLASGLIYRDETTGRGGRAQIFKLSKNINLDETRSTEQISMEQAELNANLPLKTSRQKEDYILRLFVPEVGLSLDQIIPQVEDKIEAREVPMLIDMLHSEGRIQQRENGKWMSV